MKDGRRQNPIEWDVPTMEAGGAEYTVWEAMLDLERSRRQVHGTQEQSHCSWTYKKKNV